MGSALEIITGRVVAPGTTFTDWTMAVGDSLTIRNAPLEKRVLLLQAWADNQAAGTLRIKSTKLHDNTEGIRLNITPGDPQPLLADGYPQVLVPQDTLTVQHTGSATAGDIEQGSLLIWYEDLPGAAARFITPDELKRRMVHVFTVENTLSLGTAGGYSGEEAINAEFDLFKANTDYALLGYIVSVECCSVGWRGSDVGNLRVGGPGDEVNRHITRNWFVRLSQAYGLPLIPVFNSANKSAIMIDGAQDENGADTTVTSIMAELTPA